MFCSAQRWDGGSGLVGFGFETTFWIVFIGGSLEQRL